MNKKSKRILSLAVALVLALALIPTAVIAADTIKKQMIEANYMGIKIVVNGIEVTPTDATGHAVEPFASNGTTYLPVRAVAAALGQDVEWDGETKTVYIGDNIPGKETNWMTKLPPYQVNHATAYDGSDHTKYFTVAGEQQPQGVVLQTEAEYDGEETSDGLHKIGDERYRGSAIWNTDLQYKTMNVTVGHMGDSQINCNLEVYLDGVYSTTYELSWSAAPKKLSIPVNYAPNVRLELVGVEGPFSFHSQATQYGLYDISFE